MIPPSIYRLGGPLSRWFSTYLNQNELAMSFRALEPTPQGVSRDFTLDALVHIPRTGHLVNRLTRKIKSCLWTPLSYAQGLLSPLILPSPFPWLWFR